MDTVIKTIIIWVGSLFWTYLMTPLVWLLELEFELLKLVSRYNNFSSEAGVTLGWIALRDLSNMFFILVFLVIGFATILRISSYGYQQLLRKTIIIAILINFSKTIVGFIIDVVQVIMLTFIAAVDEIMSGGLVVAIGLHNLFSLDLKAISDQPTMDFVVALVMGAALVAILLVVVGVMVMMLLMRIVALWVAIILSPLAFFASIFPATQSFYNQWLKQLGTNLVTGPMLAFFLWLTFAIVGNGEAYRSFMENKVGGGPTEFLGTSNMVNYIVSIAMLLMGIKVAARSGAAGANIAAKGMDKIQSTASKLARRYPKAAAMRMANWGAGKLIDEKGNPRDTWAGRRFNSLSTKPFWGGKMQRGLMRVQGRNAARISQEAAEDEKYINPKQRKAYYDTLTRQSVKPEEVGFGIGRVAKWAGLGKSERLGKILQGSSSWAGGHFDSEIKKAVVMSDRNEINNQGEADFVAKQLERVNDQPRLDRLRKQWANTYSSDEEVDRSFNESTFGEIMRNQKAEAALDENGKVTDGARMLIEGAWRDKDTVGYDMYKGILSLPKKVRVAWSQAMQQVAEENADMLKDVEKYGKVVKTKVNEKTGVEEVELNEKGAIQMNTDHEMVKSEGALLPYPHLAGNIHNGIANQMEELFAKDKIGLPSDYIDNLKQRGGESNKNFEARILQSKNDWAENDKKLADGNISTQEFYKTRRNIMGMYTDEEAKEKTADPLARIEAAKEKRDSGQISQEQYDQDTKNDRKFVSGVYQSPLLHLDEKQVEIAALVGKHIKPAPERGKAEAEKVTDEKVEELAKEKMKKEEGGKILGAYGQPVVRSEAETKKLYEEKKAEAKKELEKKSGEKAARQQKELDDKYDKEVIQYNLDTKDLEETIKKGLSEIAKSQEQNRLDTIDVDIKDAHNKGDKNRETVLLAEKESITAVQNKRRREILGLETSNTRNYIQKAILKDATDGFDYSRLQEMPIHEQLARDLFKELARVATQDQQREMLQASNPNQIELFAKTLVPTGQKLNKAIVDNLTPNLKEDLFRLMHVMRDMQEGMSEVAAIAKAAAMDMKELSNIK